MTIAFSIVLEGRESGNLTKTRQGSKNLWKFETNIPPT